MLGAVLTVQHDKMKGMITTTAVRSGLLGLLAFSSAISAWAQTPLRVCQWNVTLYGTTTTTTSRRTAFQTAFYGIFNGRQLAPDVIAAQEILSDAAAADFLTMLNTAPGSPGDWARVPFIDGADTDGTFFFRTTRAVHVRTIVAAVGSSSTTNQPRNTYRHDIRPIGYSAAATELAIYNSHMKAGDTATDVARRLVECNRIVADSALALTPDHFILCGDFNQQNATQDNYEALVGPNPNVPTGPFYDPIFKPGNWENNAAFANIHTQEPSTQMDSRHDQILISRNLWDNVGWDYIGNPSIPFKNWVSTDPQKWNDPNHSYRCWGNDGNTFNTVLATTTNTMVGPTIAQALITSVGGGGHLPVYVDMRVPARGNVSTTFLDFGLVDVGTVVTANFDVLHTGDTAKWGTAGLAALNYTLSTTAGASITAAAQVLNPAQTRTHTVTLNTATGGVKTGTITVTTDDPENPLRTITWQAVVVGKFNGTRPGPRRP